MNNSSINFQCQHSSTSLKDIHDGVVFRSIRASNPRKMLTLTMNIDGVQMSKGCHSSVWPILFVINELPHSIRYDIENVILAGVWPGPSKPNRDQIRLIYRPIIDELLALEYGHSFKLSSDHVEHLHVYLIAACCDKPAQALIQSIAEPTAAFGCGRCEIEGDVFFLSVMGEDFLETSSDIFLLDKDITISSDRPSRRHRRTPDMMLTGLSKTRLLLFILKRPS